MKAPSEQRLQRTQRMSLIIGFTMVFCAGTTLIIEREKLKESVTRNLLFEEKEVKRVQAKLDPLSPDTPICE